MLKIKHSLVALVAGALLTPFAFAAPVHVADIAGIKTGEKLDMEIFIGKVLPEVNANYEITRIVNKSKELAGLIGQEKFTDKQDAWNLGTNHHDKLFVHILEDGNIQQVIRVLALPAANRITVGQLREALNEKYGEPTEDGGFDAMAMYYNGAKWAFDSSGKKLAKNDPSPAHQACQKLYKSIKPSNSLEQYTTVSDQCGYLIQVTYIPERGNYGSKLADDAILTSYSIGIYDVKSAYDQYAAAQKAAEQAKKEAEDAKLKQAQANKPKI